MQGITLGHVTFKGFNCIVKEDKYWDGTPAIILYEEESWERVMAATVNLGSKEGKKYKVAAIKNYSENEGILEILIEANIISCPVSYVHWDGHATIPVCKIHSSNIVVF